MPALLQLLAAAAAAPADTDADLLGRFVTTRDGDAFAELVRRHGPAVLGTCRRLVGRSAADDAFQATFLVLAARAGSVRKAASVGSWLVGVAGRVGRRMRGRDRRQETGAREPAEPACLLSPDSCLLADELGTALADEFTRLPDKLRAAAVACLLDGRTQDQAAAVLGWSSRTVRRRLDEAKELLRDRLTRRGVAPAAAGAALAACGEATAVPASLARQVTDGAALFLAGGGADLPAAALAHGVIGAMTTIRSTAAAAVCVAVLAGLGVGWANDAAPQPEPERIPAPATKAAPPADSDRIPAKEAAAPGPHVYKTANFVVTAPTAAVARTLGDAYEARRKASAVAWTGADLPAWKEPVAVRVEPVQNDRESYSVVVGNRAPGADDIKNWSCNTPDGIVKQHAPLVADQLVVRTVLGRRPPGWAIYVLNWMADPNSPPTFWTGHVVPVRRLLEAGEALHLSALFEREGLDTTGKQTVTVVGYCLSMKAEPRGGRALTTTDARRNFLHFLKAGAENGWERAAKDVYGFASLAAMERAWIEWVRAEPGPAADPDRIPPQAPAAVPAAQEGVVRTANFAVVAATRPLADQIAAAAEKHRRELAKRWFGAELPDAAEPVAIRVTITSGNPTGVTTFTFGEADGKRPPGVKTAVMELKGPLDAVLKALLPHEVTHVVLATHFGRPLPRWADEGIAVLAESDAEQFHHEVRVRELLNAGRAIRLSVLLRMTDYPRDAVVTFAQGHSVCRFLLDRGARRGDQGIFRYRSEGGPVEYRVADGDRESALVAFLAMGMARNTAADWEAAAKVVYGFDSLDALEAAWIESLRAPPRRR